MPVDLDDAEVAELIALLTEQIANEHHHASARAMVLQAILDKLESEGTQQTRPLTERSRRIHSYVTRWTREVEAEERAFEREQVRAPGPSWMTTLIMGAGLLAALALIVYASR
jgi:hypothetical protein